MIPALVLMRLVPPFMSPDENVHIARADMLVHGKILLEPAPKNIPIEAGGSGGEIDKNLFLFILQSLHLNFPENPAPARLAEPLKLQNLNSFEDLRSMGQKTYWSDQQLFSPASGTGYYFPVIYIPHAAALWLGKNMGLSLMASYDLVRITVATICITLIILSAQLLTLPPIAVGILFTPMALFQWISPTIDGLTMGLTLYAISIFLAELKSAQPSSQRQVILAISIFIISTTRIHMLPMLALQFYLAWHHHSKKTLLLSIENTIFSLGWIIFAVTSTIDTRINRSYSTIEIVRIYINQPIEFIHLLYRTLSNQDLQNFYFQSFIGKLGWLDAPIDSQHLKFLTLGLVALFFISLYLSKNTRFEFFKARVLLIIISLSSIIITFAALAITWTSYPADTIQGIQGRYFILPIFVACCALWIPTTDKSSVLSHYVSKKLFGIYILYSVYVTGITLIQHYQLSIF
ncbi:MULTISPECIES: DUF2142 domain-containing protein [Giesbergeria]|uniref:DUF2142 domain-containing protein n=1 Tax=Giesbergeria sinuosa TaxID=80883 RepID=A0ABV9QEJ9_9BURK